MLQLVDVVSGYGSTMVLNRVQLTLVPGQVEVVLGRNGVGKSTLLKTIIGQLPVRSGQILLDGATISDTPPHRRSTLGIAYVPQGREIFPALTVTENLRVAASGLSRVAWRQKLEEVMEEFPALRAKAGDPGRSLSGGQQQILALARALISDPRVLLLDEPSEGIQPSIVAEIADTIRRIAIDRRISVLIAEQNLDFVTRVTSNVDIFDHGEFVKRVTVSDLMSNLALQHEYLGV